MLWPLNGRSPTNIAYNITPVAQTSTGGPIFRSFGCANVYGAINFKLPVSIYYIEKLPAIPAIPKSTTLTWVYYGETNKIFYNFKSLCIRLISWQWHIALTTCLNITLAYDYDNFPFFSM